MSVWNKEGSLYCGHIKRNGFILNEFFVVVVNIYDLPIYIYLLALVAFDNVLAPFLFLYFLTTFVCIILQWLPVLSCYLCLYYQTTFGSVVLTVCV